MAELDCNKPDPLAGNDKPELPLVTCGEGGEKLLLDKTLIDGQEINDAQFAFDTNSSQNVVNITFKSGGSETWAKFTENIGKRAAFTLDTRVVSAPTIRGATPAGSTTQVTGNFGHRREGAGEHAEIRLAAAVVLAVGGRNSLGDTGTRVATVRSARGRDRPDRRVALLPHLLPNARHSRRFVVGAVRRHGVRDPGAARAISTSLSTLQASPV